MNEHQWQRFMDLANQMRVLPEPARGLLLDKLRCEEQFPELLAHVLQSIPLAKLSDCNADQNGGPVSGGDFIFECFRDLLEDLRRAEHELKASRHSRPQELLQVESRRKAMEETMKEFLRAEQRLIRAKYPDLPPLATEEEIAAGLQELNEKGGLELWQFIGELEQLVQGSDASGR